MENEKIRTTSETIADLKDVIVTICTTLEIMSYHRGSLSALIQRRLEEVRDLVGLRLEEARAEARAEIGQEHA